MPAGIQIWGDHGFVQITDAYSNFAFRAKGVVALDGNGRGSISFSGMSHPMVCVQSGSPVALLGTWTDGWSWTFTFNGSPGASFWVFTFDDPVFNGGSKYGLQIFKDDGSLAFDSNMKYMKIAGIGSPPGGVPGYNATWEYNPLVGGSYAVCMTYVRTGIYSIPFTDVIYCADHVYTTGNGAGIRLQGYAKKGIWDQGDGNGLQIEAGRAPTLVLVDVSQL